ncbi:hypothetical protein J2X20_005010 [Pelomonas saccharophila]|uniref:Uncharacterized protein n=1 Tax=Roseateles saccharophilus TaxID=304 RepID=A0ABU1YWG8_ROSSA|nr:hypothetical protein [Roseateles saccharophilus]MDR7272336.1 hypothetical protein [Roseateles saccharophilus]
MRKPGRWLWPTLAVAVLAVTVLAYRHPAVMVQLSEQIWACFG